MDLAKILQELKAAQDDFRHSDKAFATATFCQRTCKVLDEIVKGTENEEFEHLVIGIWIVISSVNDLLPQLIEGPLLTELAEKLFRQCARVVLDIKWQQLDPSEQSRENLENALSVCHQYMAPRGFTRFGVVNGLMAEPWTDPVLTMVMGNEEDNEGGEGLAYIKAQDPEILKLRVDLMYQENCDEFALNLCFWCLKHPALAGDFTLHKIQFILLHRLGFIDRLQEECQSMGLVDSIRLINSLHSREEHQELSTMLAQTFLIQNWIKPTEDNSKLELLRLWIRLQQQADEEDQENFVSNLWAVAKVSQSTEQLLLIIDAVREKCGDTFLQFYLDLCIFAINVDKGCWEKLKGSSQTGPNEELMARKRDMAQVCNKLAHIVSHESARVAFCCALTSFAMLPSEQALQAVRDAFQRKHQAEGASGKSQCCSNCASDMGQCLKGENTSRRKRGFNVATLYEVERLCSMLRPAYLSCDSDLPSLLSMCKQYLKKEKGEPIRSALLQHKSLFSHQGSPSVKSVPAPPQEDPHPLPQSVSTPQKAAVVRKTVDASSNVSNIDIPSATPFMSSPPKSPRGRILTSPGSPHFIQRLVLNQLPSDTVQILLSLIQSKQILPLELNNVMTKYPDNCVEILENYVSRFKRGDVKPDVKPEPEEQKPQLYTQQSPQVLQKCAEQQLQMKMPFMQQLQQHPKLQCGGMPSAPQYARMMAGEVKTKDRLTSTIQALQQTLMQRPLISPTPVTGSKLPKQETGVQQQQQPQVEPHSPRQGRLPSHAQYSPLLQKDQQIRPDASPALRLQDSMGVKAASPVQIIAPKQPSPMQISSSKAPMVATLKATPLVPVSGGSAVPMQRPPHTLRLPYASGGMSGVRPPGRPQLLPKLPHKTPGQAVSLERTAAAGCQVAVSSENAGNRHYSINNLLFTGEQQSSALSITLPDTLPEISLDSISDTLQALNDPPCAGSQVTLTGPATQSAVSTSCPAAVCIASTAPAAAVSIPSVRGHVPVAQVQASASPDTASFQRKAVSTASTPFSPHPGQVSTSCKASLPSFSSLFVSSPSALHLSGPVSASPAASPALVPPSPAVKASPGQASGGKLAPKGEGVRKSREWPATDKEKMMQLLKQAMTIKVDKKKEGGLPAPRLLAPSTASPHQPSLPPAPTPVGGSKYTAGPAAILPASRTRPGIQQSSPLVPTTVTIPRSLQSVAPVVQTAVTTTLSMRGTSSVLSARCTVTCAPRGTLVAPSPLVSSQHTSVAIQASTYIPLRMQGPNKNGDLSSKTAGGNVLMPTVQSYPKTSIPKPPSSSSVHVPVQSSGCSGTDHTPVKFLPAHTSSIAALKPRSSSCSTAQSVGLLKTFPRPEAGEVVSLGGSEMRTVTSEAIPANILPEGGGVIERATSGNQSVATYRCIICAKAFMTLNALRYHVKQICKPSLTVGNPVSVSSEKASEAGVETSTVFQCMRCYELCISHTGIREHKQVCSKGFKEKAKPKSKAKPKVIDLEQEEATQAKVQELLNKCLGENREKLQQEAEAQAAKLANARKKLARKRPSVEEDQVWAGPADSPLPKRPRLEETPGLSSARVTGPDQQGGSAASVGNFRDTKPTTPGVPERMTVPTSSRVTYPLPSVTAVATAARGSLQISPSVTTVSSATRGSLQTCFTPVTTAAKGSLQTCFTPVTTAARGNLQISPSVTTVSSATRGSLQTCFTPVTTAAKGSLQTCVTTVPTVTRGSLQTCVTTVPTVTRGSLQTCVTTVPTVTRGSLQTFVTAVSSAARGILQTSPSVTAIPTAAKGSLLTFSTCKPTAADPISSASESVRTTPVTADAPGVCEESPAQPEQACGVHQDSAVASLLQTGEDSEGRGQPSSPPEPLKTETTGSSDSVSVKQEEKEAAPAPQYTELRGSCGRSFFRCANCGQTLCSMQSLSEHWQECISIRPLLPVKEEGDVEEQSVRENGKVSRAAKNDGVTSGSDEAVSSSHCGRQLVKVEAAGKVSPEPAGQKSGDDHKSKMASKAAGKNGSAAAAAAASLVKQSVVLLEKISLPEKCPSDAFRIVEQADSEVSCASEVGGQSVHNSSNESLSNSSSSVTLKRSTSKDNGLASKSSRVVPGTPVRKDVIVEVVSKESRQEPRSAILENKPQMEDSQYCSVCKLAFSQSAEFTQHLAGAHLKAYTQETVGSGVVICHFCQQRFSDSSQCISHSAVHSEAIVQMFKEKNYQSSAPSKCRSVAEAAEQWAGHQETQHSPASPRDDSEEGDSNEWDQKGSPETLNSAVSLTKSSSSLANDRRSSGRAAQKQALNKIYISSLGINSFVEPLKESNKRKTSTDEMSIATNRPKRTRLSESMVELMEFEDEENSEESSEETEEDDAFARKSGDTTDPLAASFLSKAGDKASMGSSKVQTVRKHRLERSPHSAHCSQVSASPLTTPKAQHHFQMAPQKPSFMDSFLHFVNNRSPDEPLPLSKPRRRYSFLNEGVEKCSSPPPPPWRRSSCEELLMQSASPLQTAVLKLSAVLKAAHKSDSVTDASKSPKLKSSEVCVSKQESSDFENVYFYGECEKQLMQQVRVNLGPRVKAGTVQQRQTGQQHNTPPSPVLNVKKCSVNLGPKINAAALLQSVKCREERTVGERSEGAGSEERAGKERGVCEGSSNEEESDSDTVTVSDSDTVVASCSALSPVRDGDDTISLDGVPLVTHPDRSSCSPLPAADKTCREATQPVGPLPKTPSPKQNTEAGVSSVIVRAAEETAVSQTPSAECGRPSVDSQKMTEASGAPAPPESKPESAATGTQKTTDSVKFTAENVEGQKENVTISSATADDSTTQCSAAEDITTHSDDSTTDSAPVDDSTTDSATVDYVTEDRRTVQDVMADKTVLDDATSDSAAVGNFTADKATVDITADRATIDDITANNVSVDKITGAILTDSAIAKDTTTDSVAADDITADSAEADDITRDKVMSDDLTKDCSGAGDMAGDRWVLKRKTDSAGPKGWRANSMTGGNMRIGRASVTTNSMTGGDVRTGRASVTTNSMTGGDVRTGRASVTTNSMTGGDVRTGRASVTTNSMTGGDVRTGRASVTTNSAMLEEETGDRMEVEDMGVDCAANRITTDKTGIDECETVSAKREDVPSDRCSSTDKTVKGVRTEGRAVTDSTSANREVINNIKPDSAGIDGMDSVVKSEKADSHGPDSMETEDNVVKSEKADSHGPDSMKTGDTVVKSEKADSHGPDSMETEDNGVKSEKADSHGPDSMETEDNGVKSEKADSHGPDSMETEDSVVKSEKADSHGPDSMETEDIVMESGGADISVTNDIGTKKSTPVKITTASVTVERMVVSDGVTASNGSPHDREMQVEQCQVPRDSDSVHADSQAEEEAEALMEETPADSGDCAAFPVQPVMQRVGLRGSMCTGEGGVSPAAPQAAAGECTETESGSQGKGAGSRSEAKPWGKLHPQLQHEDKTSDDGQSQETSSSEQGSHCLEPRADIRGPVKNLSVQDSLPEAVDVFLGHEGSEGNSLDNQELTLVNPKLQTEQGELTKKTEHHTAITTPAAVENTRATQEESNNHCRSSEAGLDMREDKNMGEEMVSKSDSEGVGMPGVDSGTCDSESGCGEGGSGCAEPGSAAGVEGDCQHWPRKERVMETDTKTDQFQVVKSLSSRVYQESRHWVGDEERSLGQSENASSMPGGEKTEKTGSVKSEEKVVELADKKVEFEKSVISEIDQDSLSVKIDMKINASSENVGKSSVTSDDDNNNAGRKMDADSDGWDTGEDTVNFIALSDEARMGEARAAHPPPSEGQPASSSAADAHSSTCHAGDPCWKGNKVKEENSCSFDKPASPLLSARVPSLPPQSTDNSALREGEEGCVEALRKREDCSLDANHKCSCQSLNCVDGEHRRKMKTHCRPANNVDNVGGERAESDCEAGEQCGLLSAGGREQFSQRHEAAAAQGGPCRLNKAPSAFKSEGDTTTDSLTSDILKPDSKPVTGCASVCEEGDSTASSCAGLEVQDCQSVNTTEERAQNSSSVESMGKAKNGVPVENYTAAQADMETMLSDATQSEVKSCVTVSSLSTCSRDLSDNIRASTCAAQSEDQRTSETEDTAAVVRKDFSSMNSAVGETVPEDVDSESDLPELCIVPDPQGTVIRPKMRDGKTEKKADSCASKKVEGESASFSSGSMSCERQYRSQGARKDRKIATSCVEVKSVKEDSAAPVESPAFAKKSLLGMKSLRQMHKPEPFSWDEEEGEEDCRKTQRNERSLKAFRSKVHGSPFSWDPEPSDQWQRAAAEQRTAEMESTQDPSQSKGGPSLQSSPQKWGSASFSGKSKDAVIKPIETDFDTKDGSERTASGNVGNVSKDEKYSSVTGGGEVYRGRSPKIQMKAEDADDVHRLEKCIKVKTLTTSAQGRLLPRFKRTVRSGSCEKNTVTTGRPWSSGNRRSVFGKERPLRKSRSCDIEYNGTHSEHTSEPESSQKEKQMRLPAEKKKLKVRDRGALSVSKGLKSIHRRLHYTDTQAAAARNMGLQQHVSVSNIKTEEETTFRGSDSRGDQTHSGKRPRVERNAEEEKAEERSECRWTGGGECEGRWPPWGNTAHYTAGAGSGEQSQGWGGDPPMSSTASMAGRQPSPLHDRGARPSGSGCSSPARRSHSGDRTAVGERSGAGEELSAQVTQPDPQHGARSLHHRLWQKAGGSGGVHPSALQEGGECVSRRAAVDCVAREAVHHAPAGAGSALNPCSTEGCGSCHSQSRKTVTPKSSPVLSGRRTLEADVPFSESSARTKKVDCAYSGAEAMSPFPSASSQQYLPAKVPRRHQPANWNAPVHQPTRKPRSSPPDTPQYEIIRVEPVTSESSACSPQCSQVQHSPRTVHTRVSVDNISPLHTPDAAAARDPKWQMNRHITPADKKRKHTDHFFPFSFKRARGRPRTK